jgi:hypothetical protein
MRTSILASGRKRAVVKRRSGAMNSLSQRFPARDDIPDRALFDSGVSDRRFAEVVLAVRDMT